MSSISFKDELAGSMHWAFPERLTERIGRLHPDEQTRRMETISETMKGIASLVAGVYVDPNPVAAQFLNEALMKVSERLVSLALGD